MDDDGQFLSQQWAERSRVGGQLCMTFSQCNLQDAVVSAMWGRPMHRE
jgi:hypothetical protein